MNELTLRLQDGTLLVLPASLEALTTYVILEQETWFEKEVGFVRHWLKPGMTAIDIGANVGVYSLPMARLVAPHGKVFAYEPGRVARGFLESSRRLNRADNLEVIPAALSNRTYEAHLTQHSTSELNELNDYGLGEVVQVTTLDTEDRVRGWKFVDFVKIDAEGSEQKIIEGGKDFFERCSPLVMFEVGERENLNTNLRITFREFGYRTYRLLAGMPLLVPDEEDKPLDPSELNLFAAKSDRAAALEKEGLLAGSIVNWAPDDQALDGGLELLKAQSFAGAFTALFAAELDRGYVAALAGYAAWRSSSLTPSMRYAALRFSFDSLTQLCRGETRLERLSTLARVAWEAGERVTCATALMSFARFARQGNTLREPFWPASPRFDSVAPGTNVPGWFVISALEQLERVVAHSSIFGERGLDRDWICAQPFISAEMERRRVLCKAREGQIVEVPERLRSDTADHLNAACWRAGLVPNTRV